MLLAWGGLAEKQQASLPPREVWWFTPGTSLFINSPFLSLSQL